MIFKIKPLNKLERLADILMTPIMYLVSGVFSESPQKTHLWNNIKISENEAEELNITLMQKVDGVPNKVTKNSGIRFHCPIIGGWREYVVICPVNSEIKDWYAGWHNKQITGISRIKLSGSVRLLIGFDQTFFFGISTEGEQIPIRVIGCGRLGIKSQFSTRPLL